MHKVGTLFLLSIIIITFSNFSCSPKLESYFLSASQVQLRPEVQTASSPRRSPCYDPLSYIPDSNHLDHTPFRFIRVNFHWLNNADSTANYHGEQAERFSKEWIDEANKSLGNNKKLWLPIGNDIPVLPTRFRYRLAPKPNDPVDKGVYCHFTPDESCYYVHKGKNRNLGNRAIIKKYGVQLDTVLNIFVMPNHPDSIASETYPIYSVGVALGNAVKIAGVVELGKGPWYYKASINHEVGHILGLGHAWVKDGCDDTMEHKGDCWNRGTSARCDTMTSNNIMDYSASQVAFSPCQIGKMHMNMTRQYGRARKYLIPKWCQFDRNQTITITEDVEWRCEKDLQGHVYIEPDATLTMNCRVSMPPNSKIVVKPGGKLILNDCKLHNACGKQWKGIEIQQIGQEKGEVTFLGSSVVENAEHSIRF